MVDFVEQLFSNRPTEKRQAYVNVECMKEQAFPHYNRLLCIY